MGHENILVVKDERSFEFAQAIRFPINDRDAVSETMDGSSACARLMGSFKEYDGGEAVLVFNSVRFITAFNDFIILFRFTPRNATECGMEVTWLVDEQAEVDLDYDLDKLNKIWDITAKQDKTITEANQVGVSSSRYQPGPYSDHEKQTQKFTEWYLDSITDRNK